MIPNVHCRLAVYYAWDKAGFIRAYGGAVAGVPAGGMAPPGISGYTASFNPYPSGPGYTGDDVKAKQELAGARLGQEEGEQHHGDRHHRSDREVDAPGKHCGQLAERHEGQGRGQKEHAL